MKKLMIVLLLLLPIPLVSGQDKIITIDNDTILCRIISIAPTSIQYEQKRENQQIVGKFIPAEQVLEYVRNVQSPEISPRYRTDKQAPKPLRHWLIGVQLGGASLLASSAKDETEMMNDGIPKSQAKDYCNQLKQGWSFSGDIHYLLSNYIGLGVKYSFFTSSVNKGFTIKIDEYYPEYFALEINEKQYIQYAGPSVIFQQWLGRNRKFQLRETFSTGFVHYRDELRMFGKNALAERNTWGVTTCVSANYHPISWLSIGLNAGFMNAYLTKVDVSTKGGKHTLHFDNENYINLSRLDYSLSICFHF